jgi:hypothetical protein
MKLKPTAVLCALASAALLAAPSTSSAQPAPKQDPRAIGETAKNFDKKKAPPKKPAAKDRRMSIGEDAKNFGKKKAPPKKPAAKDPRAIGETAKNFGKKDAAPK